METRYNRIFITGASGTGKTTLAKWISTHFDIPFISTSAKKFWPKYGFENHREAIIESINNLEIGQKYQNDIMRDRISSITNFNRFVTDRSPFDNYAHYLLQGGFMYKQFILDDFAKECSEGLSKGDLVIFIRFSNDIILEDDGSRIKTPSYQKLIDSTIKMVIDQGLLSQGDDLKLVELRAWDIIYRRKYINKILKPKKSWVENLLP